MRKVGVMLQKYIDKYPVPQVSVLLCPLGEGGWSVEDFGGDHMGFRRSGEGISQFTINEGKGGHTKPGWGGGGDQVNSIVTQPMFSKLFSPSPPSDKWWPVLLILRIWNVQNNKRKIGSKKKKLVKRNNASSEVVFLWNI